MLFRQSGIFHTNYANARSLFPLPADRWMIGLLLAFALTAPFTMSTLVLSTQLLPWLVWTAAVLGLNLILGWTGQFHFGYAAIMGIGAYTAVHGVRNGIPWEIAMVLGGVMAAVIGIVFAFAALRVKGLYLALSTLALQFVMDWVISHVPAISGGTQATLQAPDISLLGQAITSDTGLYYVALGWCLIVTVFMLNLRRTGLGRALIAVREKDFAAILIFTFYRAATPEQFAVNVSIELLAMVIVGGLGSIIGSYFGAAFILLMPGLMNSLIGWLAQLLGISLGIETLAHIPHAVYGALIIIFLLVEPMGLGKMYTNLRNYLLVWPFGYARK